MFSETAPQPRMSPVGRKASYHFDSPPTAETKAELIFERNLARPFSHSDMAVATDLPVSLLTSWRTCWYVEIYADVAIDRFIPSMVDLKLSASALRALNPATAAARPRPAIAPPSGVIEPRSWPNALTPVLLASVILAPRPRTAETIWFTLPVFTPKASPRLLIAWSPVFERSFRPCFTSLAPLSKSLVSAPIITFMLGSFVDI